MEREVKIVLDEHSNIKVIIDDTVKKEITKENRQINALEIFDSLDIDYKNRYELVPIQEKDSLPDAIYDVLQTFYDLYKEIISEINGIIAKKLLQETETKSLTEVAKDK